MIKPKFFDRKQERLLRNGQLKWVQAGKSHFVPHTIIGAYQSQRTGIELYSAHPNNQWPFVADIIRRGTVAVNEIFVEMESESRTIELKVNEDETRRRITNWMKVFIQEFRYLGLSQGNRFSEASVSKRDLQ